MSLKSKPCSKNSHGLIDTYLFRPEAVSMAMIKAPFFSTHTSLINEDVNVRVYTSSRKIEYFIFKLNKDDNRYYCVNCKDQGRLISAEMKKNEDGKEEFLVEDKLHICETYAGLANVTPTLCLN